MNNPQLTAQSADAIAWHLEQGQDNGGLSREALSAWLRGLAKEIREDEIPQDKAMPGLPVSK